MIRPSAEYAAPAWHSLITATQAAELERQQTQALKNIFGPSLSANKLRQKANIDLLSKRREGIVLRFAQKCVNNVRSRKWFCHRKAPVYSRRSNVYYPTYIEETAPD